MVTHNTWVGWQAASLVAAAVSAGVNGADTTNALQEAIQWVDSQPMRGSWAPKASVLTRVQMALEATDSLC